MIKFKIAALFFASTTFGLVIAGIIAIKIYSYQIEQAVASDIYTHASFLEAVETINLKILLLPLVETYLRAYKH